MDDIKLFATNENELVILIHAIIIYSRDVAMKFGIEKFAILVMKSCKRYLTGGMELPNQEKIRTLGEKETYQYLGILEAVTIKQLMKEKIKKEYLSRTRKLLKIKLYSGNLIKGINTWSISFVRYSGPFLKWTGEEYKQMDLKTKTLLTVHKALHSRDEVDRLYVSRKGGRGLASIGDSVGASIQRLEDYIEKRGERNNPDNTRTNRTTITRKQKWEEKQLYGCFKRLISNISHEKNVGVVKKRETKSLLKAAKNDAIRTNHIKARIDKSQHSSRWRSCGDKDETINYIIRKCRELAQKEYKTWHNLGGQGVPLEAVHEI